MPDCANVCKNGIHQKYFEKQRANYFWRSQGYDKTGNCVFQKLFTAELAYVLSCLLERLGEEEEAGWEAKQTSKKEEQEEEEKEGEEEKGSVANKQAKRSRGRRSRTRRARRVGERKGEAENKQAKRSTTHKHTRTGGEEKLFLQYSSTCSIESNVNNYV